MSKIKTFLSVFPSVLQEFFNPSYLADNKKVLDLEIKVMELEERIRVTDALHDENSNE